MALVGMGGGVGQGPSPLAYPPPPPTELAPLALSLRWSSFTTNMTSRRTLGPIAALQRCQGVYWWGGGCQGELFRILRLGKQNVPPRRPHPGDHTPVVWGAYRH